MRGLRFGWCLPLLMAAACAEARRVPEPSCGETYAGTATLSDRLDVLFVVDTSPSMVQERSKLLAEMEGAARFLTEGLAPSGYQFARIPNIHVGVVSTDLGSQAGAADGCTETGADARLQAAPACRASRGDYVWYHEDYHDAAEVTAAMSCIADVPTSSCTVSQPLEATLEAFERNPDFESWRSNPYTQLVVVIVTDRDDASLRPIAEYIRRLRKLRPDAERFSQVAVIAGVPPDLISATLKEAGREDEEAAAEIYRRMLDDPRLSPDRLSEPSCANADATAYPPRRLIELAAEWPSNVELHSICDYDLGEVIARLAGVVAKRIYPGPVCLREPIARDERGRAPCRVTWELPLETDPDEPFTPAACEDRPEFLTLPSEGRPQRSDAGRTRCQMRQAPLAPDAGGTLAPSGEGFFVRPVPESGTCAPVSSLQLEWTNEASPPPGVRVLVECGEELLEGAANSCKAQPECLRGWGCFDGERRATSRD